MTLTRQDDALSLVEDEVRELVRRRGLDPAAQPEDVRRLVEDVLADYEDRALSGPLPALGERQVVGRRVYDAVAGLGPLQPYLDDPSVEEIWINEPGRVFVARGGRSELTTVILSAQQVADLVERMLKTSGRRLDVSSPFVDARLPDGSRLHVVGAEVTGRHLAVNVRKFVLTVTSLDELIRLGSITEQAARFLEAGIVAGLNVVVAGGTQAGKTTLLNALCGAIPAHERVVSCEEVFELQLPAADWVPMQTRQPSLEGTGEIRLRRLVIEALRMRPDRLIVGEVRQEEALDLLIALNAGLPGMATIHANSAREAITKLCTLPLLAGENVSAGFVLPTVAASVDLVVHVAKDGSGTRRVTEIAALSGRCEGDVVEVSQIFRRMGPDLVRGDGFPPHAERFLAHGCDLAELLAGAGR
ncbi:MAG TPA: ATPase, T2SS/T4P/T4SS family [Mycobacteriales bacterium]